MNGSRRPQLEDLPVIVLVNEDRRVRRKSWGARLGAGRRGRGDILWKVGADVLALGDGSGLRSRPQYYTPKVGRPAQS